MFTVIICDAKVEELCKGEYCTFLSDCFEYGDYVFCEWNKDGTTLSEAVPKLEEVVNDRLEWRALIVFNKDIAGEVQVSKVNPFDFVGSFSLSSEIETFDKPQKKYNESDIEKDTDKYFKEILTYREEKSTSYEAAVSMPLVKLSNWLCGTPLSTEPFVSEEYQDVRVLNGKDYFRQTYGLGVSRAGIEAELSEQDKYNTLSNHFCLDGVLQSKPTQIIAIAERNGRSREEQIANDWKNATEFEYSQFASNNLYPPQLRYIVYDCNYFGESRDENSYIGFLTYMLIMANTEFNVSSFGAGKVYRAVLEYGVDSLHNGITNYKLKLLTTKAFLNRKITSLSKKKVSQISNDEARSFYETDTDVPVTLSKEFDFDSLFAKYSSIGLSKDCPQDEENFWKNQYHEIKKSFIRILREPVRSVRRAIENEFRDKNCFNDDRILNLNESQREDIQYHLEEKEDKIAKMKPSGIFNKEGYLKRMEEADKELKRNISYRMTKKRTVIASLIVLVSYLFGFLPLIFSNRNNIESLLASIKFTGVAVGFLCVVAIVLLVIFRQRLVNRFKHFNYEMSGIKSDISESMSKFSEYLSYACGIMRDFSIFNFIKQNELVEKKEIKVYQFHIHEIDDRLEDINLLFGKKLSNIDDADYQGVEPYDYDFTKIISYDYDMPRVPVEKEIDFLHRGNKAIIPVDYVEAALIVREELYD